MKNRIFIVVGIITLVALLIVSITINFNDENTLSNDPDIILENAKEESKNVKDSEKKKFTKINMDQYLEYFEKEEKSIILIGKTGCQYCKMAEPILQKIAKSYNLDIKYISVDNFTKEDEEKLFKTDKELENGFGTPLLMIVSQNKVIDKLNGMTDTAHYKDFFKKNGIIK